MHPTISVKLGVGWGGILYLTGTADFGFDMDFQFTETGAKSYGDITINLDWGVQLLSFDVYTNRIWGETFKMFNTDGQDEHIYFDYDSVLSSAMMSAGDYMDIGEGEFVLDRPVSREYLKDRSEWNPEESVGLASIDASGGTEESVIQYGYPKNIQCRTAKLSDSSALVVYINDNPVRSDENSRMLYYTIYDESASDKKWTLPAALEDDGTLDDYPNMQDLGNGKILVTWSSSEKVLETGADVNTALDSLNIQAKIFDKATKTFGETYTITKTTEEDKCADLMPKAAYDAATDKVILYYTKTEYNIQNPEDVATANSSVAYLFYDCANNTWSNSGDVYTDEELSQLPDEAAKQRFREQWYGQRFLYLPFDGNKNNLPLVVDSDVIGYDGYSLFTWTIDWDNNMQTIDDRDIFMQIYKFAENSFTDAVRITSESGAYASPQFARSDNATYLFYGSQTAGSDHGTIKYHNISDIISNHKYTLTNNGNRDYFELKYTIPASEYVTRQGDVKTIDGYTVTLDGADAAETNNIGDYDVFVDNTGLMYLFWTENDDTGKQIYTSVYNGPDDEDDENEAYWCEPFMLTSGDSAYGDVSGAMINDKIFVLASRTRKNYASSELVTEKHTPYAKLVITDITVDTEYPTAGQAVKVTATVKNEGILPVSAADNVGVTFKVNGTEFAVDGAGYEVPGGTSYKVSAYTNMPDTTGNVVFSAAAGESETIEKTVDRSAKLNINNASINYYSADSSYGEKFVYTSSLENTGNTDSDAVTFTAYANDNEIGAKTIDAVKYGESINVDLALDFDDNLYTIQDGKGIVSISVKATSADGSEIAAYKETIQKEFDSEAVALLESIGEVKLDENYSIYVNEEKNIQPVIDGVEEGNLHVEWLSSSNSDIVSIDRSNRIIANSAGTATIKGIIVPNRDIITFDSFGNTVETDWSKYIPSSLIRTVTTQITSSENEPYSIKYNENDGSASVYSPEQGEYCVIFAAYKNNALINIKTVNKILNASETSVVDRPDGFDVSNADTVKVFLWDNLQNITPYATDIKTLGNI